MKSCCQAGKTKKNIIDLSPAKFAQRVVKVQRQFQKRKKKKRKDITIYVLDDEFWYGL